MLNWLLCCCRYLSVTIHEEKKKQKTEKKNKLQQKLYNLHKSIIFSSQSYEFTPLARINNYQFRPATPS